MPCPACPALPPCAQSLKQLPMQNLLDKYGQPLGAITLSDKDAQTNRRKSIAIELALNTRMLTKKDVQTWRRAWQMAIHHEMPKRIELYNVYTDTEIDGHLSGAISQINDAIKQRAFKIVDRKTRKEKPEATELLEAEWFKDFMQHALMARYWGHSLIQLGDVTTTNGRQTLSGCELIPREHVVPEFGLILPEASDDPNKGIPYREGRISQWVIEAGTSHGLGLYLKASPHTISKKNMLAFWDQFGELFGHPIRIAKTSNPDPKERSRVENMLTQMGAAAWGLFPEGTEIEIKEASRGDAFEVYDRRIVRANSELSKMVLTETMTMDDGASLSQSQVHEKMFKQTVESEADRFRDLVNNRLIPRLAYLGFALNPATDLFEWEYALEYTPEQLAKVEEIVARDNEIDPKYWQERYGIPVIGKKQQQPNFNLSQPGLDFFV